MTFGRRFEGYPSFAELFGDHDPRTGRRQGPRETEHERHERAEREYRRRRCARYIEALEEYEPDDVAAMVCELAREDDDWMRDGPPLEAVREELEHARRSGDGRNGGRDE